MKPKKILLIVPLPPPYYGSALSNQASVELLRKSKKFEIRTIKLNYSKEMKDVGRFNLEKIGGFFSVIKEIKNKIRSFNPDLIYIVPATSNLGLIRDFYFTKIAEKNSNNKIVLHLRSRILEKDWKNPFLRFFIKNLLKRKKIILIGKELKGDLQGTVDEKEIFILPNAIKNEITEKEFSSLLKKREKERNLNLLFLSNMEHSKGWMKVLKACKILKEKRVPFRCNFVGGWKSKKDEKEFFNFVKENKLDKNIFYLGKRTGEEKNKILRESNILVFPTEYPLETFGRVIVEGMMFGLPIIANSIATIPSIVDHGKTGFLLEKNTPEEIAKRILELQDPKKRKRMGLEGRKKFLKEFELKIYEKRFIEVLKRTT